VTAQARGFIFLSHPPVPPPHTAHCLFTLLCPLPILWPLAAFTLLAAYSHCSESPIHTAHCLLTLPTAYSHCSLPVHTARWGLFTLNLHCPLHSAHCSPVAVSNVHAPCSLPPIHTALTTAYSFCSLPTAASQLTAHYCALLTYSRCSLPTRRQ
jgi:hypothetical protein